MLLRQPEQIFPGETPLHLIAIKNARQGLAESGVIPT
jgi:hypothetical protein